MPTTQGTPNTAVRDQLLAVEHAIREYHFALDRREHGDVAAHTAIDKIEDILGLWWTTPKISK